MKKQTHGEIMENVSPEDLEELVAKGKQLHDQAVGGFFFRLLQKAVLLMEGISPNKEDATQSEEISLKRSRRVAVC